MDAEPPCAEPQEQAQQQGAPQKEQLPGRERNPSEASPLERLSLWLPPLICSGIFVPCVTYSEWYVDELFAVLRNEDARGESTLRQVFTNDFWGNPLRGSWTHKSYRPFSVLSFAWQFKLLEEGLFRPQPLRAFNVALHACNTLLVLLLLRHGLRLSRTWSRLAACLFAAHPVHTENIVYLVGRADMLATTGNDINASEHHQIRLGWLLASVAYLHVRRRRPSGETPRPLAFALLLLLCTALAVIGGLCKESGFTLLVFVAGIELSSLQPAPRWSGFCATAVLAAFTVVAFLRHQVTQGTSAAFGYVDTPVQFHDSKVVRTWSYLFQHSFYAKLLVLPGDLAWDYSFDSLPVMRAAWRDARALPICSTYLAICALASWCFAGHSGRRALLGLQHIIVPFVPASNLFFTVGVTIGERLLYPSTVGVALVAAALGDRSQRHQRRSLWLRILGYSLLCFYCWRCSLRVWQWRSSEALYAADAAAWPQSVKTRHQLGTVYHAEGRYAEALEHYEASLAILNDNALTDHCIAQIHIETGNYNKAIERFEKIYQGHLVGFSRFNIWMLHVDYGFSLVAMRRFEDAIQPLKEGLGFNLAVPHGLNALGYAHLYLNQLQEAQDAFAKGLEYDPENAVIWSNIGVVWMMAGALQNAAHAFEKALTLEPNHPIFVHNALLLKHAAANGGVIQENPRLELFFSRMG